MRRRPRSRFHAYFWLACVCVLLPGEGECQVACRTCPSGQSVVNCAGTSSGICCKIAPPGIFPWSRMQCCVLRGGSVRCKRAGWGGRLQTGRVHGDEHGDFCAVPRWDLLAWRVVALRSVSHWVVLSSTRRDVECHMYALCRGQIQQRCRTVSVFGLREGHLLVEYGLEPMPVLCCGNVPRQHGEDVVRLMQLAYLWEWEARGMRRRIKWRMLQSMQRRLVP